MNNQVDNNSQIDETKQENESFILFAEEEINEKNFGYQYSKDFETEDRWDQNVSKTTTFSNKLAKWDSKCLINFNTDVLGITPMCNKDYQDIKAEELKFGCALLLLETDVKILAEHNMKDYLNGIHEKKRNNIPKLWTYDYQSTYATNYTDEQRINKNVKFINNLL